MAHYFHLGDASFPLADPDIRLGGHVNPAFGWGTNLICFAVSHIYFFDGGGPKSIAKLHGAMSGFSLTPWICHCSLPFLCIIKRHLICGARPFRKLQHPVLNVYVLVLLSAFIIFITAEVH